MKERNESDFPGIFVRTSCVTKYEHLAETSCRPVCRSSLYKTNGVCHSCFELAANSVTASSVTTTAIVRRPRRHRLTAIVAATFTAILANATFAAASLIARHRRPTAIATSTSLPITCLCAFCLPTRPQRGFKTNRTSSQSSNHGNVLPWSGRRT